MRGCLMPVAGRAVPGSPYYNQQTFQQQTCK
jgi:hypothetical protein